jgi:hypothetical protein
VTTDSIKGVQASQADSIELTSTDSIGVVPRSASRSFVKTDDASVSKVELNNSIYLQLHRFATVA